MAHFTDIRALAFDLDGTLIDSAPGLAAAIDRTLEALSLLEPLIMAILSVLVGGLVIAMYLPIFKLGAVV